MGVQRYAEKLKRSISKRLPVRDSVATIDQQEMINAADVPFLLPACSLAEAFEGADVAEVTMLPRLIRSHKWAMPEHELLTLGCITRVLQPKLVVEFGTFMGGSTLTIAANMPAGGRVVTIDLDPQERKTHVHGMGVGLSDFDVGCLFRGTRFEPMIEQRFANSVEFHDRDLLNAADLVFVDADHTYEFAKRDTQTAIQFTVADGAILWHDYTWEPKNPECVGVTRAVNEFYQERGRCIQLTGTRFALHTPKLQSTGS